MPSCRWIGRILSETSVYQVPTINQMQVRYALCHPNEKKEKKKNPPSTVRILTKETASEEDCLHFRGLTLGF